MNELSWICKPCGKHRKPCQNNPCKIAAQEGDFPPDTCPFDGTKVCFVEIEWKKAFGK